MLAAASNPTDRRFVIGGALLTIAPTHDGAGAAWPRPDRIPIATTKNASGAVFLVPPTKARRRIAFVIERRGLRPHNCPERE